MLTRYILHINNTAYQLQDDDLKNWEQIECSYKRTDFDGVVRSFTSQFEFVNHAADLIAEVYLRDGVNAVATIDVQTINNNWVYGRRFECPLDFTTIVWKDNTITLNAIDNSTAAVIKANKSTKYELTVGEDIRNVRDVKVTRIPMLENITYGFTQGDSYEDSADITQTFTPGVRPWIGNKGSEVLINKTIAWEEDQTNDANSYIFEVIRDVKVRYSYDLQYRANLGTNRAEVSFPIKVLREEQILNVGTAGLVSTYLVNVGTYSSHNSLPDIGSLVQEYNVDILRQHGYAVVAGIVYTFIYSPIPPYLKWESAGLTEEEFYLKSSSGSGEIQLKAGDKVYIDNRVLISEEGSLLGQEPSFGIDIRFAKSDIIFEWLAKGDDVFVDGCTPKDVGESILRGMNGNSRNIHVDISNYDPRIANTYIVAGDSLRGIDGAKLHTSFNEYCDWMSTVFGYVYCLGEPTPAKYQRVAVFGRIVGTPYTPAGHYDGNINEANIKYNPYTKKFFYQAEHANYASWHGSEDYNDERTGLSRTDTVFIEKNSPEENAWVFPSMNGTTNVLNPVVYDGDINAVGKDEQTIHFLHRSELFGNSEVRKIYYVTELTYSVDSGSIYSAVTIGYDKKDYDSINGRDEFNFNNTYSTGCIVSDKTLSMLSKYRADSYGMEFAIQKRSAETSDSSSDKDVFFILCAESADGLCVDKSCAIENGLTRDAFNGAFSPMACARANAGYIGMQAKCMTLQFTSSTANSDIVISGEPMTADIPLGNPYITVGVVEFTTSDLDVEGNENDLIEVSSNGMIYRGYLKEVDTKYARAEAAKYKLIVKNIEPC